MPGFSHWPASCLPTSQQDQVSTLPMSTMRTAAPAQCAGSRDGAPFAVGLANSTCPLPSAAENLVLAVRMPHALQVAFGYARTATLVRACQSKAMQMSGPLPATICPVMRRRNMVMVAVWLGSIVVIGGLAAVASCRAPAANGLFGKEDPQLLVRSGMSQFQQRLQRGTRPDLSRNAPKLFRNIWSCHTPWTRTRTIAGAAV